MQDHLLTDAELRDKIINDFASEAEKLGAFVYESISRDILTFLDERGENALDYAEDIAFAAKGMAISLAVRMRFELLEWGTLKGPERAGQNGGSNDC